MYIHARSVCPKSGRNKLVVAIASALIALPFTSASVSRSAELDPNFPGNTVLKISATDSNDQVLDSLITEEKYKRLPEFSTERWALFLTDLNWSTLS